MIWRHAKLSTGEKIYMQPNLDTNSTSFTLIIRWAIVLALSVLLISMATGQYGISNYRELVKNKEELIKLNTKIAIENQLLQENIEKLKTSRDAQVHYLKANFGYVERGEFVYRFDGKPNNFKQAKKPSRNGSRISDNTRVKKIGSLL